MEHFLRRIAKAYIAQTDVDLGKVCFIFPNKRAIAFFRYEMEKAGKKGFGAETMRSFSAKTLNMKEVEPLDAIFTLFNCYARINKDAEFDKFRFWGEMILSDFNDIDRSLADAEKLFENLKDVKEIATDFLTDEQREIIRQYFPKSYSPAPSDRFWKHFHGETEEKEMQKSFKDLWEILYPLYQSYNKVLKENNTASAGQMLRLLGEGIANSTVDLKYERYVFVGFVNVSKSEIKIFRELKKRHLADFYWEMPSEPFIPLVGEMAEIVENHKKNFPSLYKINEDYDHIPQITINAVSSATAQAAIASRKVCELIDNKYINDINNAVNTAIVLPEESLYLNVVESLPKAVKNINVTIGVPMRSTPIASFVSTIVALQYNARKIKDKPLFFFRNIEKIVTTPLMTRICPEGSKILTTYFRGNHDYMLSEETLQKLCEEIPETEKETLNAIFSYADTTLEASTEYLSEVLNKLKDCLGEKQTIECFYIDSYLEHVKKFKDTVSRHGIIMCSTTFLRMIEHLLSGLTFRVKGEPVHGLQVMGTLETRALNFDNLIILSMNEGKMPHTARNRSFIPENIRLCAGLPPCDIDEQTEAFYFFRLLSYSQRANLIYDSRETGMSTGEMSRFLIRLLYCPELAEYVTHTVATPPPFSKSITNIELKKTPEVMEKLGLLKASTPKPERLNLSPSSINTYISCPLHFYLKYVLRLDVDDTADDYIDTSDYGKIVHRIFENVYNDFKDSSPNKYADGSFDVTPQMIDDLIKNEARTDSFITKSFNEILKIDPVDTPLKGESRLLAKLVKRFIVKTLEHDKNLASQGLRYIASEEGIDSTWEVDPSLSVNFKFVIDRIDEVAGKMRIVDYKTGSDKITFEGMDDLFDPAKKDRRKAILQTILYCHLYNAKKGQPDREIQPIIYQLSTIFREGIKDIRQGSGRSTVPFDNYQSVIEDFVERMNKTISQIFDTDTPIKTAENPDACKYCNFRSICSK